MTRRTTVPRLVRGSVINHRRRCGGAKCRCTDGVSLHESTVLSSSEEGRTRFLMLPPEFVEPVRAATDRYRAARGGLEDRANAGLAALTATIAAAKAKA